MYMYFMYGKIKVLVSSTGFNSNMTNLIFYHFGNNSQGKKKCSISGKIISSPLNVLLRSPTIDFKTNINLIIDIFF